MKSFVCSFIILFTSLSFSQDERSYNELITLLNQKLEKVKELENRSEELIREKNNITDRERVVQIIAELNQIQNEIQMEKDKMRELDYDLRFRYPEKGDQTDRVYKSHNSSSKEVLKESELLIDRLDMVLKKAKKVYGPTQREMETARKAIEKEREEKKKPENRFKPIIVNE